MNGSWYFRSLIRVMAGLIFVLLVTACAPESSPETQPPAAPTEAAPPVAAETEETAPAPTEAATETAIPATEAAEDPAAFREDFEGSLGEGWEWHNEDPGNWSLTEAPGSLQISIVGGQASDDSITNILLREAPAGDFQMETKVTVRPQANYQFAGLVAYESPSNLIQAGRAFCDAADVCTGEGLYLDHYYQGDFITPNLVTGYTQEEVYLRLTRRGDTYTFETSPDGNQWTVHGDIVSEVQPQQIGLMAGQNTAAAIPAVFDYFEVRSAP